MNKYLSYLAVFCLIASPAALADSFLVGSNGSNIQITTYGPDGGATAELVGYLINGGATQEGSGFYKANPISGSYFDLGGYSFVMTFQPGEEKSISLQANLSGSPLAATSQGTITVPDASSAVLYSLMSKSGVQPRAGDPSLTLYGKNVICWVHEPLIPFDQFEQSKQLRPQQSKLISACKITLR